MTCWRIKAETGSVEDVAREPRGVRDVFEAKDDQEELLNAAAALAPEIVDAAGELPVRFIGGTGSPTSSWWTASRDDRRSSSARRRGRGCSACSARR